MKKIMAALLAVMLMIGLCACTANPAPSEDATAPVTEQPVEQPVEQPAETEQPAEAEQPAEQPAVPAAEEGAIGRKLSVMLPVLDSLVRTLGIAGETGYLPEDAAFVWNVLYLMGENYGGTYPTVTVEGADTTVPVGAMRAFYGAAFAGRTELPAQPDDSKAIAAYDAEKDAYLLAPSDMGAAEVMLERYYALSDGGVLAVMGLYNVDEWMGSLAFVLTDNPDAGSFYPYAVTAAYRGTEPGPGLTALDTAAENAYDLNGDGEADRIAFSATDNEGLDVKVTLSDGTALNDTFEYAYNASAFVGDLKAEDGRTELFVCADVGSDDYVTRIYRVADGALRYEELGGVIQAIPREGELVMDQVVDVLGTYGALRGFRLAGDGVTFEAAGAYRVCQPAEESRQITTVKDGLPVTDELSGQEATVPAGTRLLLLATDGHTYAVLEREDGSCVRLALEEDTEEWGYRIAGVAESEWFGELLYAG